MFHLFCNSTAFSGLKYPLFPSKFEPLKALGCAPSAPKPVLKFRRPKCRIPVLNLLGTGFNDANSPKKQPRTLFPGGFKRPEIKAPSLVLRLNSGEVLRRDGVLEVLDMAVSEAVSIVVLESGGGEGGRLYEAACILKALVRDRAYLLIAERVDIAAAVGASGVVLSDQGLPAIVARNMMMESKSGSVVLPLVVRMVQTAKSALSASASEGADFLIFGINSEEEFEMLAPSVFQHVKVPVFPMIDSLCGGALLTAASRLLQAGASGLVISSEDLKHFSDDVLHRLFSTIYAMKKGTQDQFQRFGNQGKSDVDQVFYGTKRVAGFTKSEDREKQMIEAERLVLLEAIPVIRKAAPLMEEVSLLMDAVAQLDEPFLLVIVGEFNSGKSTVINALLGRRYLRDGVVPTTNEITLLCYSEMDFGEQERSERHPDGQFIRFLPAPILKEMNLVDTPGTNVILQRQQRLTEEFLPRADLLLFVISADRPLTESEVTFLRYVQQWKKKVVFVLNKSDLYQNSSELEEATAFIKENAQKLLNTEYVTLYPISARSALEAKLSALTNDGSIDEELLSSDPRWKTSSFNGFQKFLLSFLDRATDMGIERVRLKLETPIGVAETLISACEKHVLQECDSANRDLVSVKEIVSSVKYYAEKMENESISWRKRSSSLIETAKTRAVKLVESTLQLSNLDLVASYAFKGEKSSSIPSTSTFQNEIISPALSDTKKLLEDYLTWLESSCYREGRQYKESFEKKWPTFVNPQEKLHLETQLSKGEEHSVLVTEKFSPSATAKLFDREIREVLLGTFGGLGAAGLSASLLTSVLPTTLEDLLALGLCSAGGLLSISNFPARRNEVADKVKRAANSLQNELEEAMQKDLMQTIGNLERFVESISRPYRDAVQHRLDHLLEIREELQNMDRKLRTLQLEIQNLHVR